MNICIITGVSSGIGSALARQLLEQNSTVIGISRTENQLLTQKYGSFEGRFKCFRFNLNHLSMIPKLMEDIFEFILIKNPVNIALVNNAGIIEPIGSSGNLDPALIEQSLATNLIAPSILSNEFIRHLRHTRIQKSIINISSGAAISPYAGWSNYCASKAGLDMLTRTISLEQKTEADPVRIISVAPGIVDTGMQTKIRGTETSQFPMKDKFVNLYQNRLLSNPDDVATRLIPLIFSDHPASGSVIDLRNV